MVVELFAFCADEVVVRSNEVTKITATASDNENTSNDRMGLRIGLVFLLQFFLVRFLGTTGLLVFTGFGAGALAGTALFVVI